MGRRKKRLWSDVEKREICRQTDVPCVSVAQVGQRYAVNANLIFKWLKDPRFVPDVVEGEAEQDYMYQGLSRCGDSVEDRWWI